VWVLCGGGGLFLFEWVGVWGGVFGVGLEVVFVGVWGKEVYVVVLGFVLGGVVWLGWLVCCLGVVFGGGGGWGWVL